MLTVVLRVVSVLLNRGNVAHFHIEFYPLNHTAEKLEHITGSEVWAGAFTLAALPETTATTLREAIEEARR
ncbi:MAG: hypothetical protein WKF67_03350 [Rubrobacteraceae bacterium]|jgi:galactose-1-phosphate uridylyltransferase